VYPYFIDVQTPLLSSLETRVVIPLSLKKYFHNTITKLNPLITIGNKEYVVLTQQLTAIPVSAIGSEVSSHTIDRKQILASIDFLITGI
jgi:toxin CcdB